MSEKKTEKKSPGTSVTKIIDGVPYEVVIHFSENTKETMSDKIKRMMKKDVENGNY